MTDDEIDKLSGRALDVAVCRAIGWEKTNKRNTWWKRPDGYIQLGCEPYSTDIGAAMGLLLDLDVASDEFRSGIPFGVTIWPDQVSVMRRGATLASGPKSELASVCCRAWLKIQSRKV